ncbi:MAG: thiamine phosphate synthase [Bacteroidaceae bacterium]|nr:thiamine phosphate synthase [Bacteroidaceae bacterium]MBR3906872.1 thiamine phosphate synthase [Bacteroidaceae bacterium]
MKLAVITKPTFFVEEDKIITRLFDEGLDCLFLYKEYAHPQFMERLLNLIPKKYHKKIYTCNNRLMQEYKMGGTLFMLGSNPPMGNEKGKLVGYANNLQHLKELRKTYDIVCFGPLGRTFYQSTELNEIGKKVINRHIWAFGDIDEANLKRLTNYGFGGVIIDELMWSNFDSCRSTDYSELIDRFKRIKKAVDKL